MASSPPPEPQLPPLPLVSALDIEAPAPRGRKRRPAPAENTELPQGEVQEPALREEDRAPQAPAKKARSKTKHAEPRIFAGIPAPKASQSAEADKTDTTDPLFIQPTVEKEVIPSPRFFMDVVQNQWASPGTATLPNASDKHLYNVASDFAKTLEVPSVDLPVIALSSPNAPSAAPEEALHPEGKKVEQTLVKGHQASAWVVRASTSASFFSRSVLLWLRQLQARLPARDSGLAGTSIRLRPP
ncbi:PREDICTED: uncharacterized protein LOC106543505 [Thamnophis sirtalis]|uniref:Uncharacterized protein LOC106543505 n=1 Tax=Thamnophis sirtalis TaxID=35019 RepID=A0A6I9XM57_9SAUR|nr:PREDICTED: uncharacterized protein LOC106543505 [Thamnophis sirtalis]